ncbi:hypothetical protein L7F22_021165 [Adiantum nelumboides]|nr:hypothetical protein [Adiantum nelumboides]
MVRAGRLVREKTARGGHLAEAAVNVLLIARLAAPFFKLWAPWPSPLSMGDKGKTWSACRCALLSRVVWAKQQSCMRRKLHVGAASRNMLHPRLVKTLDEGGLFVEQSDRRNEGLDPERWLSDSHPDTCGGQVVLVARDGSVLFIVGRWGFGLLGFWVEHACCNEDLGACGGQTRLEGVLAAGEQSSKSIWVRLLAAMSTLEACKDVEDLRKGSCQEVGFPRGPHGFLVCFAKM